MKSQTIFLILVLLLSAVGCFAQDSLFQKFQTPPNSAKPRVWWHWMNGNITKEGIKKDLLWMKRAGIGGFQNFDASLRTPKIVEKRLLYMTPEWKEAFRYTAKLADSLELEMAIAGSPGWSETGGPWVKPEDGMKKLVWTEVRVSGGAQNIKIDKPPAITGPFQNILKLPLMAGTDELSKATLFYKDIATVAFRLPTADKSLDELKAVVSSSGGKFTLKQLTDGDLNKTILLPRDDAQGFSWIQFAFPQPQTIKAITMAGGGFPGFRGWIADPKGSRSLEAGDDGVTFKFVCAIPRGGVQQQTVNIPPTKAKYFRVTVKNPTPKTGNFYSTNPPGPGDLSGTEIAEIVLHPLVRVQMFEEKDAFAPAENLFANATPLTDDAVAAGDIIDLTDKLNADGTLRWKVPSGQWKVIRFGYSLTGTMNHPASPEATGPEADKLDAAAVKRYFTHYLDDYKNATGGLMGSKGLQYLVIDSWEAGAQNWTANFPKEFLKRRGYNMLRWMPVLAGNVVKSSEASEQFLFDFRKTLGEMVAEYHYDATAKILAERGMKCYFESHERRRAFIGDGMEVKRTASVPMSAIWTPNVIMNQNDITYCVADIRESASVAHIYGQNLVAAESLTALGPPSSAYSYYPETLKPIADLALAHGLNRFIIHTCVHQPTDDKVPGLGLGPYGQWFTRHETWAEYAHAWTAYLSRSCYLLQQGKFMADIVYYYGEDNNITSLFGKNMPSVPEGYNYDFINSDALLNRLSVKDKKLVTSSGMTYQVLVLDENAKKMPLSVLRKLRAFIKSGVVLVGAKPEAAPSLADNKNEFIRLANEIWNPANPNVFSEKSLSEALSSLGIKKDFSYVKQSANSNLLYVHRRLPDLDIYWINNRSEQHESTEAEFRLEGKTPELWHPETGRREPVSCRYGNGVARVKLSLAPHDAVFVVFGKKEKQADLTLPSRQEQLLTTIDGAWKVTFQKDRGAPAEAVFPALASFAENQDNGIKYFSGTAVYSKAWTTDKKQLEGNPQLWLDLGDVKNIAEVKLNGKAIGVLWRKPFRIEITHELKAGENFLEIKTANLWVNRLIGDQQPNVSKKITFTSMPFYQADSPLLPSGLLGPVRILTINP